MEYLNGRLAGVSHSMFIDGEKIANLVPYQIGVPENKETWKLYMRRKNKLYFKSPFGKRSLELNPMPEEMMKIKYGDVCEVKWN